MWYRYLLTDPGRLYACSLQPSVRAHGRQVCVSENGLALVVEPGGLVRDLRPDEDWDSQWCWADLCGHNLLVYRPEPTGQTIVAFQLAEIGAPTPATPPPPPTINVPPRGVDAFDLTEAVLTSGSPDVRNWPHTTTITEFVIRPDGTIAINFDKRNGPGQWPLLPGPEGGDIQYTLWVGAHASRVVPDRWFIAGCQLCISRGPDDNYVPGGNIFAENVDGTRLGQLAKNWYYFAGEPLEAYQPSLGESVAWFVTAGVQRRNDVHAVAERSNVIVTPFAVGKWV